MKSNYIDMIIGARSSSLRAIAEQYNNSIGELSVLMTRAYNCRLSNDQWQQVTDGIHAANQLLHQFEALLAEEEAARPKQPIYVPVPVPTPPQRIYVPVPVPSAPQPSQEDHEMMCQKERLRGAKLGITSDGAFLWHMVELGCNSKEQFCQSSLNARLSQCR